MKTEVKKLSGSQVELKIEVPAEEFQPFREKAVLEIAKNFEKEGFRKGKVPAEIVEKEAGEQNIMAEAGELCIRDNYVKAVRENDINAIGQPKIEILKMAPGNPLEFKATVSVMPEIELPDYKKIVSGIERKEIKVTDSEIAKLKEQKENREKERLREEILEKIGEAANIDIPDALLESEQARMLENLKNQVGQMLGITFEEYLNKVGKNESEVFDSLKPEAAKKVRNSLVLREIAKQEKLEATEEEIKAENEKILKNYPQASQLDQERLKEYSKEVIMNEKAFQLLENSLK
ncbi:MAG: trigger factor [Candidatus Paceibacterota bacterium]|jgi:trigger factor|nr:trigger factor [Candidatus Paceibacterota bacterium]